MVRLEEIVLDNELVTSSASCCCKKYDGGVNTYNACFNEKHVPGPTLGAQSMPGEVEETIVGVTEVDLVVGVNPVFGVERESRK